MERLKINIEVSLENFKRKYCLNLEKGLYLLTGPTGSGKSTLLKALMGLRKFEGDIKLGDFNINYQSDESKWREFRIKYVSYLMQDNIFLFDNLKEELNFYTENMDFDIEFFEENYRNFNLPDKLQNLKDFSGGQQRLLQILLTLSRNVKLYLLDEPFNGLDIELLEEVKILIKNRLKDKISILVSHIEFEDSRRIILDEISKCN